MMNANSPACQGSCQIGATGPCLDSCQAACQFSCQDSCENMCTQGCESQAEVDAHNELQTKARRAPVPERLLRKILVRLENMLVCTYGAERPGISHYSFVVRPEHHHYTSFPTVNDERQVRAARRQYVPILFSVRFEGRVAEITWNEAYPNVPAMADAKLSLVDCMVSQILSLARERLDPEYVPF